MPNLPPHMQLRLSTILEEAADVDATFPSGTIHEMQMMITYLESTIDYGFAPQKKL